MQIFQGRRTLRREQVLQKTGLKRTTQHNLEKAGDFPQRFPLTPRCVVWFEDEIDQWLEQRREKAISTAPCADALIRRWGAKS